MKKSLRGYEARTAKLIYWYAFLRLSRSYSIATAYAEGKLAFRTSKRMVPDLDLVLQTYSNFGSVWKKNPLDWLTANSFEIGKQLQTPNTPEIVSILVPKKSERKEQITNEFSNFLDTTWEQSAHQPALVVAIPLKIKKVNLYEFLKQALEQHEHLLEDAVIAPQQLDQFQMTSEKVRMDALEKSYNLVLIEAQNPEFAEWQLAECLGVCSESVKAIKLREAQKAQGTALEDYGDEPNYDMSIHTVLRRYRRYAYLLSENAARGQFPLNDEVARKARGEKVVVKFASKCITRHTSYLSRQLEERGMQHQYANEFLMRDAGINRRREKEDEVTLHERLQEEVHENFLKNRRKYAPLSDVDVQKN
jgi:hypothetical protein